MATTELTAGSGYRSGAKIVAAVERGIEFISPIQDPNVKVPMEPMATAVEGRLKRLRPAARARLDITQLADEFGPLTVPDQGAGAPEMTPETH
jgi:hypothetical protein